ncbi:STAS domain-containing protein [Streptomyces sp. NPDC091272]|uniref:STAS domain-containing protein n=1 Tax=Streptomyces sp. NPDC091272 TaxID=3365981 RepID=UPI00382E2E2F
MRNSLLSVVRRSHPSGTTVLTVTGELDHHTAPELTDTLKQTPFGPGAPVVIDLSELSFCDSTGITALITAYTRANATGSRLLFTGLRPDLAHVFHTVGLDQVFTFRPTVEHALESLTS